MKKINILDKVNIAIVILNFLVFFIGYVFSGMLYEDSLMYQSVVINAFYLIFVIPFSVFIGVILNVISLVKRIKGKTTYITNILFFVLFVVMIPIWNWFFWQALLGV